MTIPLSKFYTKSHLETAAVEDDTLRKKLVLDFNQWRTIHRVRRFYLNTIDLLI